MTGPSLLGRADELAAVEAVVKRILLTPCASGALLARGEAGIGKTALLAEAERGAREMGSSCCRPPPIQAEHEHRAMLAEALAD